MRSLDDIGDFRRPSEGFLVDFLPEMPFVLAVEREKLTSAFLWERGLRPGRFEKQVLTEALNERTKALVEEAVLLAAEFEPVSLLTCLVAAYEGLRIHLGSLSWGATGKLRLEASMVEWARSEAVTAPSLAISLRLAIELVSARPPAGEHQATRTTVTGLWACACEILRVGSTSDLIRYEVIASELSTHAGRLALPELAAPDDAIADRTVQMLDGTSDPFSSVFGRERRTLPSTAGERAREKELLDDLAGALSQVAGVDLLTCTRIMASLAGFAGLQPSDHPDGYNPGGLNIAAEDDLVSTMAYLHGQEPEHVRELLGFLSIGPKPDYPDQADMPWRFGRRRSYQSRPLVRVPGERNIIWSGFHTYCAIDLIAAQLIHASLPGVEPRSPLYDAMSAFSTWRGEQFEAIILDVVRSDLRFRARKVDKLDGERLRRASGEDLGDIDVLAAEPKSRTLLNIEVVASAPARTPREIANEIRRFTTTDEHDRPSSKGRGTDADRVLERAELVEKKLGSALMQLGVRSDVDGWHVQSLIVLQAPPFVGELRDVLVPVLGYDELTQLDLCEWIAHQSD